ncbi:DUF1254 domain-containing protein [Burkholderia sp. TSV86]|uniref:DUF1254 domain-containing protein n=1 Tax=Burkholderia sp. TSV86 TaxID=1385594 RepID=UPI00075A0D9A|nr:DUF1254 domain-containing protein [Burkholderia sp. TSV86]KVE35514.1 hypothetical protein WS68_06040 [Burkholderia sp. TSV86]
MIKISQETAGSWRRACAPLVALTLLAGCASTPDAIQRKTGWMRSEVVDSYIYAYPLVLMDFARQTDAADGVPVNTLRHARALPAPGAPNPPLASSDLLASTAWLDVRDEPVVVVLPASHGRYLDARALDMWTNVLWSTAMAGSGARANGRPDRPSAIAFAASGWTGKLPAGVVRVDAPTHGVWLDVRIRAAGNHDLEAARKLQRAIRVVPLSAYIGAAGTRGASAARRPAASAGSAPAGQPMANPQAPAGARSADQPRPLAERAAAAQSGTAQQSPTLQPAAGLPSTKAAWGGPSAVERSPGDASAAAAASDLGPVEQVAALDPNAFFSRAARALRDNPPPAADAHAQQILADIGVTAGAPVQWQGDRLAAAERGVAEARVRLAAPPPNAMTANGWSWLGDGVGNYGVDYALRAYAASTQFDAATCSDEAVAVVKTDSAGRPLNGAYRYAIRFAADALPPVRAFWSLAPYMPDGALPELGRGRRSLTEHDLHRGRDGSIEIAVSATPPGGRASNWLPAPRSDFALALHLYAPKRQACDDSWRPPAVVRK